MHERQQALRRPFRRLAAIAALLALALCSPAAAAFPGANGRIAFSGPTDIRTANPDGSGLQVLATGGEPAWSADGRRLAYRHEGAIHTIGADGSDATRITTPFCSTNGRAGRPTASGSSSAATSSAASP